MLRGMSMDHTLTSLLPGHVFQTRTQQDLGAQQDNAVSESRGTCAVSSRPLQRPPSICYSHGSGDLKEGGYNAKGTHLMSDEGHESEKQSKIC